MAKFKVAVTDYVFPDLDVEREILEAAGAELTAGQSKSGDDVIALAADADAILNTYYGPLDETVISACTKLRIIVRFGIGVDTIDIPAATRHGVMVANVPDYCLDEVSDHTIALWLSLARKTILADRKVREGEWGIGFLKPLSTLKMARVGVVGFGRIGRLTARKAAVFADEVVFFDPAVAENVTLDGKVYSKVEFDELCAECDAIFLHAPANERTHHLLNAERFALMTRRPIVVNTARAELIDTDALVTALTEGRVGAVGLDLVEGGKLPAEHPLLGFDNVAITPHSAWYSEQAIESLRRLATEEVVRGLKGERPKSLLNPQVWENHSG